MDEFLAAFRDEISRGGLLVRGASLGGAQAGADASITLSVVGLDSLQVPGRIAAVVPGIGVAVMFDHLPPALIELSKQAAGPGSMPPTAASLSPASPLPEEDDPRSPGAVEGPLWERLKKMTQNEKMQMALTGSRDERTALFRDTNKMLHVFVLKNPRIGLDEVQAAAKLPQLSPEALKMVAEHREWGSNPSVCASLVRNPKTPMPLALRMLDKVPVSDLKAIAKGGARDALVHAARKKLGG